MSDKPSPGEVTRLLREWKTGGSVEAEAALFELVERELVKVARASIRRHPGRAHKIDPRELVNEAYLALRAYPIVTANRGPFYRLMAAAMRHYLLDMADHDQASKRPQSLLRIDQSQAIEAVAAPDGIGPVDWYFALDALRRLDARQADVVELRVFGLSGEEIAAEVGVGLATVKRDLRQARAFLAYQLGLPPRWVST